MICRWTRWWTASNWIAERDSSLCAKSTVKIFIILYSNFWDPNTYWGAPAQAVSSQCLSRKNDFPLSSEFYSTPFGERSIYNATGVRIREGIETLPPSSLPENRKLANYHIEFVDFACESNWNSLTGSLYLGWMNYKNENFEDLLDWWVRHNCYVM